MGGADMTQIRTYVGLDVHKSQTHIATIDRTTGELSHRKIKGPAETAIEILRGLDGPVSAVYEAGPTGFRLARDASSHDIDLRVCAPGAIPKRTDRVKTDRRDAERLARLLIAGELRFVRIPEVTEEAGRDLVRCRDDLRCDLVRARHRLTRFLDRQNLRFKKSRWGKEHHTWLSGIEFDDPALSVVFADYLQSFCALDQRRRFIDKEIASYVLECPWTSVINRLRCFRGIDTLTALGLCAEVGTFERFERPHRLAGYFGLVPSEHTSADVRRQGQITKAGSSHARRLLVEAAHHYRLRPRVGVELERRQRGQDPRACEIAWRCQWRLHRKWQRLRLQQRRPHNVCVVAMARELSMFVWEAATLSDLS